MLNHLKYFYLLVSCLLGFVLNSQNQNAKWYFGNYAALDFMTSPPTTLTNSAMYALEGCASVSDAAGNLLFYTNSNSVWDRSHKLMANGTGLLGHLSTNQGALIVKQPGNSNVYYIFTNGMWNTGLRYSVVDMSLAAGMGSVTVKNVQISLKCTEMLAGALHCNGSDVWIISHDYLSARFKAHLLTATGVQTTVVVSTIGSRNTAGYGSIKVSQNGKKLCKVQYYDSVGSSRVDLQACKLEYSIVSPK